MNCIDVVESFAVENQEQGKSIPLMEEKPRLENPKSKRNCFIETFMPCMHPISI